MPKLRLMLLAKILFSPLIPRIAFRVLEMKKLLATTILMNTLPKLRHQHLLYQHGVNSRSLQIPIIIQKRMKRTQKVGSLMMASLSGKRQLMIMTTLMLRY
jgi:hypothetical protein